ncbi:Benzil reductase ((S)-benzoin forming) [Paraburkholderia domus]|uniref:SDR family oxidoreductase n=1 Tax=Paraburkholderia domus TaxID=2793075 RepID=UPI001913A4A6|nr:SDR family oxidoreductase [Paraburkholderia domus]MBK5050815.1 SDR family oxidoreductase [Burkholderia sp. R-70006]MBK5089894.1 SDR family oxidoreductase [Burkholderia sp. R-69927]CAE6765634.1 Benzil reductase ((S)-benzoin forming) [Paraburkholderia domus]CAE6905181.1 Benzil reductase ((S)-benzoin forming) [Paraburkholderia domus]CAE6967023.1 Benzil reductase ((S)-benzoin forming) [Paraburkholderia domus]
MSTSSPIRAIVTGHTRGLGASLAEQLLARGVAVLGLSRSRHATLKERFPALLEEIELELADPTRVAQWVATDALRSFVSGAQSVLLINNAGMVQPIGPIEGQDATDIATAVSLNVATPLMLASALAAASVEATDRRIVHISSGAARNAYPGWSIYCATKAALDHHARAVALDANRALRICSLAPGVIDTNMQAEIRSSGTEQFPMREKFEDLKRNGQLSTPEQCATQLLDYAFSDAFGQTPVADIREVAKQA